MKIIQKVVVLEHGQGGKVRLHYDEAVALWLLANTGEPFYPGIVQTILGGRVYSWKAPKRDIAKWRQELKERGVYLLPPHSHEKGEIDCAATLVAKELGIYDDPLFKGVIDHVLKVDIEGTKDPFDISRCFETVVAQNLHDPLKYLSWLFHYLDAKYAQQFEFFRLQTEADKVTKIVKIGKAQVAIVQSDHEVAKSAVMNKYKPDLVVLINSSGNVQIFSLSYRIKFPDVVRAVRVDEQFKLHGYLINYGDDLLKSQIYGDGGRWFYHIEAKNLYNGSLTRPDVSPTLLTQEELITAIKKAIYQLRSNCDGEICTKRDCPHYVYGFTKCRAVRKKMYEKLQKNSKQ